MNLRPNPTWYKDAIIYEVHIRAFHDSAGDGIGDVVGLTQKLDYLEDLGITAIWLLPFCPSPLKDDGYDISDYTNINPSYGTLKDFQRFLREAHRRGLRVITELVLNHTSDQHAWFQRSRCAAPGSRWRNFYVWSDTPDKYRDARIIFKDFEASNWTWDPVAKAYFWHRFYSHQPDLNWDNPDVREAMFAAMDFWFDMGVDGLRLDAVPYLFEREGTNCENLAETHVALRELRKHVDGKYQDRMLLAEANQWPDDSVAYFGNDDECHMAFHFPVMPRLFMASRMEDRYPITNIMRVTPPIPENCQWALFLRNHDELTLEMVTDEERDYMYRTYAEDRQARINLGIRRRLAPLLENDRRRIELMNALLFSLPGTPVVYYGDEIGMGDNVYLGDRNGVRTPMQWSADRNAGFSRGNPQRLYLPVTIDPEYHYESINVETQRNNSHSLLWWMKRLIAQRKQFQAFGRGTLEFIYPRNRKVLAFLRQLNDEKLLVVANLSRFAQSCELDLSKFAGHTPVEVFGKSHFPSVTDKPYSLSLGPHSFYWFHLQPVSTEDAVAVPIPVEKLPLLMVDSPDDVFTTSYRMAVERLLPRVFRQRRWFLGGKHTIRSVEIIDCIELPGTSSRFLLTQVEYSDADPEKYTVPLGVAAAHEAEALLRDTSDRAIARIQTADGISGVLYASIADRSFSNLLLRAIVKRSKFKGLVGHLVGGHTGHFREAWKKTRTDLEPRMHPADTATLISYGEDFVLRLYRKVEPGFNPDREMQEFLTEEGFDRVPRTLGFLEYREETLEKTTVTTCGLLTAFARNAGNAWTYTLDHLGIYFERALAIPSNDARLRELTSLDPLKLEPTPTPPIITELMGNHMELIRQLGRRSAEMHMALCKRPDLPAFAPEPFTDFYRHGLYHSMMSSVTRVLETLRARLADIPSNALDDANTLLLHESEIRSRLLPLRNRRVAGMRIRIHGDFHLGQIFYTGNDVIITNFEGDPRRSMSERRIKKSALRDVASMLRSFHYVAHAVLSGHVPGIVLSREAHPQLEHWAESWYEWVSSAFLQQYMETAKSQEFLPQSREEIRLLLDCYLIEKSLLEIEFELENRPEWIRIPLHGLLQRFTPAISNQL